MAEFGKKFGSELGQAMGSTIGSVSSEVGSFMNLLRETSLLFTFHKR